MIDLTDWNWAEVISYAGPGFVSAALGSIAPSDSLPVADSSKTGGQNQPFVDASQIEVMASAEGERDGPAWLLVFRTPDGRWWFTSASCDYTGWDCLAGGHTIVSHSRDHLIRFALDDDARSRLVWES